MIPISELELTSETAGCPCAIARTADVDSHFALLRRRNDYEYEGSPCDWGLHVLDSLVASPRRYV